MKAGDSASEIAKAFGVADQDLTAWLRDLGTLNNIDPDRLEVGQVLKLPGGSVSNASASTTAQPSTSSGGTSVPGAPGAPASTTPGPGGSTSPAGPTATSQPGSSGTAVPTATSPAAAATSTPAAPGNQPVATSTTAPPASTATPGPEASIALSPTRVTEGTVMTMTLSNFPPSSTVTVCFVVPDGSQDCGEVDVDANGYFSAPGSPLPADIKEFPGQYRMDALGSDGSVASASFEVY